MSADHGTASPAEPRRRDIRERETPCLMGLAPDIAAHAVPQEGPVVDAPLIRATILGGAKKPLAIAFEALSFSTSPWPPVGSLDHQHRAGRKMHDAVGAAADHTLIERRMAAGANHQQIDFEVARKVDDVAHRVAG
jgi:hypothetical protein